jgi:hypothetical protein
MPHTVPPPRPPPAARPSNPRAPPGATLELIRVIFLSASEAAPSSLAAFLAPHFAQLQPGAALFLADGGKALALPEREAAAQFKAMLALPDVARAMREWKFVIYSVRSLGQRQRGAGGAKGARGGAQRASAGPRAGQRQRKRRLWTPRGARTQAAGASPSSCGANALPRQDFATWMHVNWYAGGGVMARSNAVMNIPGPLGPGLSTASFALEVYNNTLVEMLVRHATVDTPDPFLMYVSANCTVWPRADWPKGGLHIMRPLYIVGWSDTPTGLDFGNGVGLASLTGRWSNITFDSVVLENLGYGDPANPNATAYSVVSAANLWFFNASRWAGAAAPGAAQRSAAQRKSVGSAWGLPAVRAARPRRRPISGGAAAAAAGCFGPRARALARPQGRWSQWCCPPAK